VNRKFAAIDGSGRISVQEEAVPAPGRGEMLVEVHASLISPGTELGGVKARREKPNSSAPPKMFGYQNSGVVLELGEGCDGFSVGQRVACMGGGYAPHATHGVARKNLTVPIPGNVSHDEAAFNHLAATALNAIRRADMQIGDTLAVVGLGIIGQIACQLGRLSGFRVIALDRLPMRLDIARKTGAHLVVNVAEEDPVEKVREFTDGYGLDGAVMAFGGDATEAFKTVLKMMKVAPDTHKMGCIVIVGGCSISTNYAAAAGNVDVRSAARTGPGYHDDEWERGRDYPPVFVQWNTRRNLELVIRLIAEQQLDVKSLITHRFPLERAAEACEVLIEHPEEALGVILLPKGE